MAGEVSQPYACTARAIAVVFATRIFTAQPQAKTMTKPVLSALILLFSTSMFAQCDDGQTEVIFQIFTDNWGYEQYWEVVPTGQDCGGETLLSGGNGVDVGCDGDGLEGSTDTAMDSNINFFTEALCLTTGELFDFIFVDDYGDGGITVVVYFDGSLAATYYGDGFGNVWTFEAGVSNLPSYDSPCNAESVEVDGTGVVMNNEEAIAAIGEISPPGVGCGVAGGWCEGSVAHSVWATFVAPDGGAVEVSTCNALTTFDTQLAVYAYGDCLDQDTYSIVASNDDIAGGCDGGAFYASSCLATCLTPGESYLVQIDGWFGSVGDVEVTVASVLETPEQEVFANVNNVNCAPDKGEDAYGSIVSWMGGAGANFDVSWTGPNAYTSNDAFIYELAPGEYTGTWNAGCGSEDITETFTITVASPYSISSSFVPPSCALSTDGSISYEISGATPPYAIEVTGEEFLSNEFETLDLPVGAYTVLVTDAFGCEFTQDVTLIEANDFEFSLGDDFEICQDEEALIYGPGGYFYEWNTGAIDQFLQLNGEDLGPGTYPYILTAYNNEGCTHSDAIIITVWSCTNGVEEWFGPEVQLYPNPSQGVFTIEGLPRQKDGVLTLLDQTGRRVHHEVVPSMEGAAFEVVVDLPSGVYLFTYEEDGNKLQTRIIIE